MNSYISQLNLLLLSIGLFSFVVKVVLYYKVEKEWDSVRFLHYSRVDLKMTVNKDLRNWRKRQNLLTNVFLIFILLFAMSSVFHMIISN